MRSALPKVLQPLAGRPLLAHVLERARELSPAAIHVVFGHGGEEVRAAFPDPDLTWCEQAEQLGTGHAVGVALPAIPDSHDVLVLCGDVPLIRSESLEGLLASAGGGLALLTAMVADPTGYGRIVRAADGGVERIVEQREASEAELAIREVNTGMLVGPAARLRAWIGEIDNDNAQGEYYLTDVVALAVAEGMAVAAVALEEASEASGINDKLQLARAERAFQRRSARDLMLRGVTLADPSRIDVRGKLEVGTDVFIDVGAVFVGDVTLGDGCQIGPNTMIKDSKLGPGCVVHAGSILDGAAAGAGCSIGPLGRLRPGTELGERVRIGNFVETKQSRIGDLSKVNHLSYIGDTSIGCDVNVGAGTITCNYDGANKHRTAIGDGAFIGSGVNLVAPVEVGAGATIGAGSTVTKNVPEGELCVARSRQTAVPGWRRPQKKAK